MFPSLAELHYFIEIANIQSVSGAAQKLGISQPSLTLAMQRLEKMMEVKLFIRHKKGMTLTKPGKILLLQAKQLLQQWQMIQPQILASKNEVQGRVTLGCNVSVALYCLSSILKQVFLYYPKLEVQLVHMISRDITEQVINLSVDLGIVVNPVKHPDLIIHKLGKDEFKLWSASGEKNKLNDLNSGQAVILCVPDLFQSQWMLKQLKKKKIKYNRIVYTTSLELVANMAAQSCGVGILPARVVDSSCPKQLAPIASMPMYSDEICLIYRPENKDIMAIQKLIEAVKSYFHQHC